MIWPATVTWVAIPAAPGSMSLATPKSRTYTKSGLPPRSIR